MRKSIIILGFILVLALPLYGQNGNLITPQNGGILALLVSAAGYWLNDKRKRKIAHEKNGQIEAIQITVNDINGKLTVLAGKLIKVVTEVDGLKENVDKEIKRHDEDLVTHSKQILQLAKNGKGG